MPTFTATALDRLIESGTSKSMTTAKNVPESKQERRNTVPRPKAERVFDSKHEMRNRTSTSAAIGMKHPWARITPALYATPESMPLPDSPSSYSPSPYVIEHKRRGPRLLKSSSEEDVATSKPMLEEKKVDEDGKNEPLASDLAKSGDPLFSIPSSIEVEHVSGTVEGDSGASILDNGHTAENGLLVENCVVERTGLNSEGSETDTFLDPYDSVSVKSNNEGEGNSSVDRPLYHSTPMAEFYDAWEELSAESGPQLPLRDAEAELREIRLSLLMEIEKRKQAEEVLDNIRTQWLRIREQLTLAGLALPADPVAVTEAEQLDLDPVEDLLRQVYIARFASQSIGRGTAKAEVEMEMEAQIECKNFEIARLCDRLHYYEAVNHEMSQRNQEAIETARRLRQKRKRRQRWVWGAVAATLTLGASALAWSYMSTGRGSSSTTKSLASGHER